MKEYIEKQKWLETLKDTALYSDTDLDEYIETAPTVTQAKLESLAYNRGARAFAEKLILNISESLIWNMLVNMNSNYSDTADNIADYFYDSINDLLKEMGCCDV